MDSIIQNKFGLDLTKLFYSISYVCFVWRSEWEKRMKVKSNKNDTTNTRAIHFSCYMYTITEYQYLSTFIRSTLIAQYILLTVWSLWHFGSQYSYTKNEISESYQKFNRIETEFDVLKCILHDEKFRVKLKLFLLLVLLCN